MNRYRAFQFVVVVIAVVFFFLPDTYAVVGPVNGAITDGEGNPMANCTVTMTNKRGESHVSTTNANGAFLTGIKNHGDCSVVVSKDGKTLLSQNISLSQGPQFLLINTGDGTISAGIASFWEGVYFGVRGGAIYPGGGAGTGPYGGVRVGLPWFNTPCGKFYGVFGVGVSSNSVDDRHTQRLGPGVQVGPTLDAFAMTRVGNRATILYMTVGGEIEVPVSNILSACLSGSLAASLSGSLSGGSLGSLFGPAYLFLGAGGGVTRNDNSNRYGQEVHQNPNQPVSRQNDLVGRDDTAAMVYIEAGCRTRMNVLGRNAFLECYVGTNVSHSDGQSGNGATRAQPYVGVGFAFYPGSDRNHRSNNNHRSSDFYKPISSGVVPDDDKPAPRFIDRPELRN